MKEINLKSLMKAHAELMDASRSVSCGQKPTPESSEWIKRDWSARCERLEAARAAYHAACGTVNAVIADREGGARERKIDAADVALMLTEIEDRLGLAKKSLECVSVHVDRNAQKFPNAYKWTPVSTHFDAVFRGGSWRLTSVDRSRCGTTQYSISLTDEAKAALIRRITNKPV